MKKEKSTTQQMAAAWLWSHTKLIVNIATAVFVLTWIYSAVVIVMAVWTTAEFSYLDTLISETQETFRNVAIANIVKAGVENIFKYNDFGSQDKNNGAPGGGGDSVPDRSGAMG